MFKLESGYIAIFILLMATLSFIGCSSSHHEEDVKTSDELAQELLKELSYITGETVTPQRVIANWFSSSGDYANTACVDSDGIDITYNGTALTRYSSSDEELTKYLFYGLIENICQSFTGDNNNRISDINISSNFSWGTCIDHCFNNTYLIEYSCELVNGAVNNQTEESPIFRTNEEKPHQLALIKKDMIKCSYICNNSICQVNQTSDNQ